MKNVINLNPGDYTKQPLFFGEDLSIQRYDQFRYPKLYANFTAQISYFWRPEEVSLIKDKSDYKKLSPELKNIFTSNLKYQILLDSCQARSISLLTKWCSNPELEAAMISWQFFETIHSYSYTYIIKNVYPDTSAIFDSILEDEEIIKRATSVTKYYNDLIDQLEPNSADSLHTLKKKLYLTLMSVNILEGIRFYVSFACSFAFAENKVMDGNSKIISFIQRDENMHLALTQMVLGNLHKNPDEGFQDIVEECRDTVIQMFKDAAEEEMQWATYLFKDGSMLGLNESLLVQYMKWLTNRRTSAIGLPYIFEKDTPNPLGWISNWTDSGKVQIAPQETELTSYKIGSIKQDISSDVFDGLDLDL